MSCQKTIAETCIAKEADYLLAVKGNQKNLEKDILAHVEQHWQSSPKDTPSSTFFEERNKGHS